MDPTTHTKSPSVTGTSVVAFTFADGVMLASDTLGAYGSLVRFTDIRRMMELNNKVIVAASGDFSDFQAIKDDLEERARVDKCTGDGHELGPKGVFSLLSAKMYHRRSKMDPLWNSLLIAGIEKEKPFLATIDSIGTSYTSNIICTGMGLHFGMPLLREKWREDMTEQEAMVLIEEVMRILFYRDCRTINKIQVAKVTAEGTTITEPLPLPTKWDWESFVKPNEH
eukprot:TRINITY_DN3425_c0_g1_i2.p1 TRINITY_DN3425_c0_g1~~TRINITY_DN3425_c0_g1_i2.p1  ORF type:complete len:225 (-),score=54.81 TRINITY_DN3425_c0_g1_i2:112-786(-)